MVTSATSPRAETNTLITSIYVAGSQAEAGVSATSYIPTTTVAVARAADDFEEVPKSFLSTSDLLNSGVTISHIGHQLAGAECAAMSQLEVEVPASLKDWGAELLLTS
jgi:hypothetical protein